MTSLGCLIRNSITTADNTAFDVIRIGMVMSGVSLIALTAAAVVLNKQAFDPLTFGSGLAVIFAGGGAGIQLKRKDEAGAPDA